MAKGERTFTVIVGDLIQSRHLHDRKEGAQKITVAIGQITREFKNEFYAPPIMTRGIDELSAVLNKPNASYRICKSLNEKLRPLLFRFAVVRNTVDIAISSRSAGKMDGPAFHVAADMIEKAKKENVCYSFRLHVESEEFDLCVSELANMVHILRSEWTAHQRAIAQLYQKGGTQKAVAKELDITQQAVSDALSQAHWKDLRRTERLIDRLLSQQLD